MCPPTKSACELDRGIRARVPWSSARPWRSQPSSDGPAAAFGAHPPQTQAKPTEPQKNASRPDGEADGKRWAISESAMATHADHYDHSRLDRELAAAFRTFGLDLDVADPKAAGSRLAGRQCTPEIAAAIDEWCRVRRKRLKVTTWRRLAEVARAADPDPGETPPRDQSDRPPADVLPCTQGTGG